MEREGEIERGEMDRGEEGRGEVEREGVVEREGEREVVRERVGEREREEEEEGPKEEEEGLKEGIEEEEEETNFKNDLGTYPLSPVNVELTKAHSPPPPPSSITVSPNTRANSVCFDGVKSAIASYSGGRGKERGEGGRGKEGRGGEGKRGGGEKEKEGGGERVVKRGEGEGEKEDGEGEREGKRGRDLPLEPIFGDDGVGVVGVVGVGVGRALFRLAIGDCVVAVSVVVVVGVGVVGADRFGERTEKSDVDGVGVVVVCDEKGLGRGLF